MRSFPPLPERTNIFPELISRQIILRKFPTGMWSIWNIFIQVLCLKTTKEFAVDWWQKSIRMLLKNLQISLHCRNEWKTKNPSLWNTGWRMEAGIVCALLRRKGMRLAAWPMFFVRFEVSVMRREGSRLLYTRLQKQRRMRRLKPGFCLIWAMISELLWMGS